MKPTKQQMEDIIGQVTDLTWNYAIWWELVKKHNKQLASDAAKKYPNFYLAVARSMQQGMVVTIRRLFDPRSDCLSLRKLVRALAKTHCGLAKELDQKIAAHEGLLKKCEILRHKVYAHRDHTLTPEDSFKMVAITPNQFRDLIYFIHEMVAKLSDLEGSRTQEEVSQTFRIVRRT